VNVNWNIWLLLHNREFSFDFGMFLARFHHTLASSECTLQSLYSLSFVFFIVSAHKRRFVFFKIRQHSKQTWRQMSSCSKNEGLQFHSTSSSLIDLCGIDSCCVWVHFRALQFSQQDKMKAAGIWDLCD